MDLFAIKRGQHKVQAPPSCSLNHQNPEKNTVILSWIPQT